MVNVVTVIRHLSPVKKTTTKQQLPIQGVCVLRGHYVCIMYYLGAHLDLAAGGDREYMYGTGRDINTMVVLMFTKVQASL